MTRNPDESAGIDHAIQGIVDDIDKMGLTPGGTKRALSAAASFVQNTLLYHILDSNSPNNPRFRELAALDTHGVPPMTPEQKQNWDDITDGLKNTVPEMLASEPEFASLNEASQRAQLSAIMRNADMSSRGYSEQAREQLATQISRKYLPAIAEATKGMAEEAILNGYQSPTDLYGDGIDRFMGGNIAPHRKRYEEAVCEFAGDIAVYIADGCEATMRLNAATINSLDDAVKKVGMNQAIKNLLGPDGPGN